jgi:hypothetical protein
MRGYSWTTPMIVSNSFLATKLLSFYRHGSYVHDLTGSLHTRETQDRLSVIKSMYQSSLDYGSASYTPSWRHWVCCTVDWNLKEGKNTLGCTPCTDVLESVHTGRNIGLTYPNEMLLKVSIACLVSRSLAVC